MHSDVCETVCMYTLGSPPLPDVPPEGLPHHSLLSFASHSREPPTAFGRWRMIPSHMHARLPTVHHIVQLTASSKYHPACVCVYVYAVHHVQKALEICTAVPCIKHEDSRRKEVASRVALHLVVSLSPPLSPSPSLHHARQLLCICFK